MKPNVLTYKQMTMTIKSKIEQASRRTQSIPRLQTNQRSTQYGQDSEMERGTSPGEEITADCSELSGRPQHFFLRL